MKSLVKRCPFRPGTASRSLFTVLARSKKALPGAEVAKRAKVGQAKARTLLAACQNVFHNAPLRKAGVALLRDEEGGYFLRACEADPTAQRPPRGKTERKAKRKAKGRQERSKRTKAPKGLKSPEQQGPTTPTLSDEQAPPPAPNAEANQASEGSQA